MSLRDEVHISLSVGRRANHYIEYNRHGERHRLDGPAIMIAGDGLSARWKYGVLDNGFEV